MRFALAILAAVVSLWAVAPLAFAQSIPVGVQGSLPVCTHAELHAGTCQQTTSGYSARITDGNPVDPDRCAAAGAAGGSQEVTCRYNATATDWEEWEPAGSSFTPNADPGVDHSGYVAGHSDGTDCPAGQYARGVDASGNATGCTADQTGSAAAVNVAIDTDGDSLPDFIACRGDADSSGTVDGNDLQWCVDALTDTGGRHVFVAGGDYPAPAGLTPAVIEPKLGYDTIITLPSNTTFECASWDETVIRGLEPEGLQDLPFSIIGGSSAGASGGNTNITIKGCHLDGGADTAYNSVNDASSTSTSRMGVRLEDCDQCRIEGNLIRGSYHSGVYIVNDSDETYVGFNTIEDFSGYHDTNPTPRQAQPGIYYFVQNDGGPAVIGGPDTARIEGNVVRRGGTGFRTRMGGPLTNETYRFTNFKWLNNRCEDVLEYFATFSSYDDMLFQGNSSDGCGRIAFDTVALGSNDYEQGYRFIANGNTLTNVDSVSGSEPAFVLSDGHHEMKLIDNAVLGTEGNCASISDELYGLSIDGLALSACGLKGIAWDAANGDYIHTLQNISINGYGQATKRTSTSEGVELSTGCENKVIRNLSVSGPSQPASTALRVGNTSDFNLNCVYENVLIDHAPANFVGAGTFAGAPFNGSSSCTDFETDDWAVVTDAVGAVDCSTGGDVGSPTRNVCYCDGTTWTDWVWSNPTQAVRFEFQTDATTNASVVIRNMTITNQSGRTNGGGAEAGIRFENGTWDNVKISGLHCDASGPGVGRDGPSNCILTDGATAFTNSSLGVDCGRRWEPGGTDAIENWDAVAGRECDAPGDGI